MPLTALFLFVPIVLANRMPLDLPPHCSSEGLMESEMRTFGSNFSSAENANEIWWSTHLKMSLNDTACFFIKQNKTGSSTILHTLRYSRLEHRYSIAEKYTFGVPEIHQSCKCDCPGGETICSVNDYQYRNCTNGTLCYRTHRPFQSSSGCITSGQSELCCEIRIEPYKNMEFKAVKLKQPDTFVVLHYRIFIRQNGKWKRDFEDKSVRIPLNTGSAKVEQNSHAIHFIVGSGRPHRQVEPGMYFWDARNKQLHGNVQLNDPQEKSLDKLGWFRLENNQWTVQQGLEKITHAQHVSVENCKAQRYRFSFTAEQFVLMPTNEDSKNEPNSYNLGTLISNEKWVQSVELGERFVIINHGEGSELSLHVKTKTQLGLVHQASEFSDFSGIIQMDKDSNFYMNLTFYEVRGTMIGELYRDESSNAVEMMFSVQTSDQVVSAFQSSVAVPPNVNSRRKLCVHPSGNQEAQKCLILNYEVEPMRTSDSLRYHWLDATASCEGCNERGLDGFLESLNPKRWLMNGFQTPTDVFVVVVEATLCIATFLLSILILTKCVIPMIRCLICVARPLKTSSSRKQLHIVEKF